MLNKIKMKRMGLMMKMFPNKYKIQFSRSSTQKDIRIFFWTLNKDGTPERLKDQVYLKMENNINWKWI